MRKLAPLIAVALCAGCVSPNWMRLIPENKDADIQVNTVYGTISVKTRVNPSGTNGFGALPGAVTATPIPANAVILSR